MSGMIGSILGGGKRKSREPTPAPVPAPIQEPETSFAYTLGIGTHGLDQDSLHHIKQLGMTHIRCDIKWSEWLTSAEYRENRQGIHAATDTGLKVLVVIHDEPADWRDRDLGLFVSSLVGRFTGVEAWQIANERPFLGTSGGFDWADTHNIAASAVRAANPDAKVVSLAFAPIHLHDPFALDFIATTPLLDVLAIHCYGWPLGSVFELAKFRAPIKWPVWLTEFGMDRDSLPAGLQPDWELHQLEQWRSGIAANERLRLAERLYGYALMTRENHVHYGEHEEWHGIYRRDWTPRPTAEWLLGGGA